MSTAVTCRQPFGVRRATVPDEIFPPDTILLLTRRSRSLPPSVAERGDQSAGRLRDLSFARSTLNASTLWTAGSPVLVPS